MHYIFEAIIVGIYSVVLFTIVNKIIENIYVQLFFVGFIKHFLGGYLNIHNFYCNYGYSCYLQNDCKNGECYENKNTLFLRSFLEGFLYLIVGIVFIELPFKLINIYLYFIIGVFLHLSFEYLKLHSYFCKNYCIKKK